MKKMHTKKELFFEKKNRHQNSLMPEISDDLIITIIFSLRHNSPFLQELWQVFQLLFWLFFLLLPF